MKLKQQKRFQLLVSILEFYASKDSGLIEQETYLLKTKMIKPNLAA